MPDFLQTMLERSRRRVAAARAELPEQRLRERIAGRPDPLPPRFDRFGIIAEIKPISPAEGVLRRLQPEDCARLAKRYAEAGAAAISVLTEPTEFGGSLALLEAAADAAPQVPVLRKDFLADRYQLLEARAHGASGVLLIVKLLSDLELEGMLDLADELGLFVLLESFDEQDLLRAKKFVRGALLHGVNSRDLATLAVDHARLERLAPLLPQGSVTVAESGLASLEAIAAVRRLGYRAALVGSALMRSPDPAELIRRWSAA